MTHHPAPTQSPIHELLARRWSSRAFDPDQAVPHDVIVSLCEAANWAPSCFGDQPWRYLICHKFDHPAAWQNVYDCLSPGNQQWAQHAPLFIITTAVTTFSHNDAENRWAGYDAGAASLSLCLQATALGLHTHQMGGYDRDRLRRTFQIPADQQCWAIIALGYPAPLATLPPELQERERKPRTRRPVSSQFFVADFTHPFKTGSSI